MDKRGNVLLSLAFYPEDESYPAAILRLTLGRTLTMKLETTAPHAALPSSAGKPSTTTLPSAT